MTEQGKRHAPAAERNRGPILNVLASVLPEKARVLEIGSGTGQHAAYFTAARPNWIWQPTDQSSSALESIDAHRRESGGAGFLPPVELDVLSKPWPAGPFDAVFSANVIHISPWPVALAIFRNAAVVVRDHGLLIFYGPFRFSGEFTAPSNAAFDARLRGDDPEWGVRDVDDLIRTAEEHGFAGPDVIEMPTNNHVLVFRRA